MVAARSPRVAASLLAGAVAVGAAGGWAASAFAHGPRERVGTAHSAEGAISIEADGWTYGVPLDAAWTDGAGGWHSGSRPACLPPTPRAIPGIRFTAVPVETRGVGFRQVVAVHCD